MFSKDKQQRIRIDKGDSAEFEFDFSETEFEESDSIIFTLQTDVVTNSLVDSKLLEMKKYNAENLDDSVLKVKIEPQDTAFLTKGKYLYRIKQYKQPKKIKVGKCNSETELELVLEDDWYYFTAGTIQYRTDAKTIVKKVGVGTQPSYRIFLVDGIFTFEIFSTRYFIHQDVYTLVPEKSFIVQ